MNWKLKAMIQFSVAALPDRLAQLLYFRIQKKTGDLEGYISPRYRSAAKIGTWANQYHSGMEGKTVLEVGTGRSIELPIACWIMGAKKIISVDLNRYLRPELILKSIQYLRANRDKTIKQFSSCTDPELIEKRLDQLIASPSDIDSVLKTINLEYLSPADASSLPLKDDSIDFHISLNVFEHIPSIVLTSILEEAKRLLKPDGAMIYFIDPSDHFAHSDETISFINFLQYTERQWNMFSGNRFMYHNRMRAIEYESIISKLGLKTIHEEKVVDSKSLSLLKNGFSVNSRFSSNTDQENATSQFQVLLRPD